MYTVTKWHTRNDIIVMVIIMWQFRYLIIQNIGKRSILLFCQLLNTSIHSFSRIWGFQERARNLIQHCWRQSWERGRRIGFWGLAGKKHCIIHFESREREMNVHEASLIIGEWKVIKINLQHDVQRSLSDSDFLCPFKTQ
jgi:hypothetical protein